MTTHLVDPLLLAAHRALCCRIVQLVRSVHGVPKVRLVQMVRSVLPHPAIQVFRARHGFQSALVVLKDPVRLAVPVFLELRQIPYRPFVLLVLLDHLVRSLLPARVLPLDRVDRFHRWVHADLNEFKSKFSLETIYLYLFIIICVYISTLHQLRTVTLQIGTFNC